MTYDATEKHRMLLRSASRIADKSVEYLRPGTTIVPIRNVPRNTFLTKPYIVLWMSEYYPEPTSASETFRYYFGLTTPTGTWPFLAARREDAWTMLYNHWWEALGLELLHTTGELTRFVREAYKVTTPDGAYEESALRTSHRGLRPVNIH